MKLAGNKIIITGATRGIGLALLDRFHGLGNEIIAVAKNQSALDALRNKYDRLTCIQCDLSKAESVQALAGAIRQQHADANTLINNAGIQVNFYESRFAEDPAMLLPIKDEIQINFSAPIELSFLLIPTLIKNDNASVVFVSSGLSIAPKKSAPVYCGTKAGIHIMAKALRYQYEDSNLRIFEIVPPLVDTEMTRGRGAGKMTAEQLADEFVTAYKKDQFQLDAGKTKMLRFIQRILPRVADNIVKDG